MRILGIIPARGGSKGIVNKNIKMLNGKPLLAYTSEIALQSKLLTNLILSSDSEDIIKVAKQCNIDVPFLRPQHLALDSTPSLDVLIHAIEWYQEREVFFDAVCLLQTTSPFRTVAFLDEAILKFKHSNSDSLISVQEVPHEYNPHWTFELDDNSNLRIATGEKNIISRRQDLPQAFHRDGSIYITKTNVILNQKSLYGEKTTFIKSNPKWYVNIDTMEDWEKAEKMVNLI